MPSFDGLRVRRRLGSSFWLAPRRIGPDGFSYKHVDGSAVIIVTGCAYGNDDWLHASISRTQQMPSYDDLKHLHRAVFGNGWAYQVFAPPSDHVNIHAYALHLWGRLDGEPALPDFTMGTGSV